MQKFMSLSVPIWIVIWAVAIFLTSIGGIPGSENWKPDIQLPGTYLVLLLGWFIGPLGTIMTPLVIRILTIFINVVVYYVLVRIAFFIRHRLKTRS